MPATLTYPGVYIEEIPSAVHTITGVATSITAFVGYTARGLDNRAKRIFSFADFERAFGGLAPDSELSYAVQQFFQNGGTDAYVVRVPKSSNVAAPDVAAAAASITLEDSVGGGAKAALKITALSKGAWANNVIVDVDYDGVPASDATAFNLTFTDLETLAVETFSDVTMDSSKANYVVAVVNDEDTGSQMVSVSVPDATAGRPVASGTVGADIVLADVVALAVPATIKITSDLPTGPPNITAVVVPFLEVGDTIPGSILGLCRLLERKINLAIDAAVPGASVQCVPSSSGKGIRVLANFSQDLIPGSLDAMISFTAGTPASALTAIKLRPADATANVAHYVLGKGRTAFAQTGGAAGVDGTVLPKTADLIGVEAAFTGIYALEKVDLFNMLSIPDATRAKAGDPSALDPNVKPNDIFAAAETYCNKRRAFLLIDPPPNIDDVDSAADWKSATLTVHDKNGAAFFPRLRLSDPLNDFTLRTFAPSGVVAGVYARTDGARGVWKAPAGVEATLTGVQGLIYKLTDDENGALNPLGLNCFRNFPIYGNVLWGARTLVGSDAEGSEWKYVPVRRMALFLEESLYRGTKWVVFEGNDESLWAQIRLNLGAFMQSLFIQGAFQGKTPREAYFVKCDSSTTTQDDINRGIVNILVGFAPLKPAEFVVIKIQQLAGQIQA
jgi:phage tail sheath protein FI